MKNRKSDEKFGAENNVGDIIEQLAYRGDLKFRLSAMLYKGVSESRDYGDGEPLKMLDAHILVDIDKYPGILSADLAQRWCRTRSAICIIVQRLVDNGYIYKEYLPDNKKERALFCTEKGKNLCRLHRQYDAMRTSALINDLLRYCTADEIEAYFKVLDLQIRLMQKGYYIDANGTVAFNYEEDK